MPLFPNKKFTLVISCFLIPSFLFWCSGIHKDGLLFLAIAFIMYHMQKLMQSTPFEWKRVLYISVWLLLIWPMRNYVTVALLPALLAWLLTKKFKKKAWLAFILVYTFFGCLFFTSRYIHPKINLPLSFSIRQNEFLQLKGNSYLPTTHLLPGLKSFIHNLPEALNHSILRPYPTEIKNLQYLAAAIEVLLFILLIGFYFIRGRNVFKQPVVLFAFFFSLSLFLIIGYIIPFIGAIVRYRSILLPLIISPLLASIRFNARQKES
jgi:hypothetical protein